MRKRESVASSANVIADGDRFKRNREPTQRAHMSPVLLVERACQSQPTTTSHCLGT